MKKLQILLPVFLFFFSSCATIFGGNQATVRIKNLPETGIVKVNGIPQRSNVAHIRKSDLKNGTATILVTNKVAKIRHITRLKNS